MQAMADGDSKTTRPTSMARHNSLQQQHAQEKINSVVFEATTNVWDADAAA